MRSTSICEHDHENGTENDDEIGVEIHWCAAKGNGAYAARAAAVPRAASVRVKQNFRPIDSSDREIFW